jgi:hypothetical protein
MPRGLRAKISPNEQRVLVSLSLKAFPERATSSEFERLLKLGLIEVCDGRFDVSPLGRERLAAETLKRPTMSPVSAGEGRTSYEAAAWGDLSTEELEGMRSRIDAACPDIARTAKICSTDAGLVIEISGIATDEQIARLQQWLLDEAALRLGPANTPAEGGE